METDYVTADMAKAGAAIIKAQCGVIANEEIAIMVWVEMSKWLCAAMEGTTPDKVYPNEEKTT